LVDAAISSDQVPSSVKQKIVRATQIRQAAEEQRSSFDYAPYEMGLRYDLSKMTDVDHRRYLVLQKQILECLCRKTDIVDINVGITTDIAPDGLAFADHWRSGTTYHFYRGYGLQFMGDAQKLKMILGMLKGARQQQAMREFLAPLVSILSHELTHVLKENTGRKRSITHDPKFNWDHFSFLMKQGQYLSAEFVNDVIDELSAQPLS